jgi:hypothetical protein
VTLRTEAEPSQAVKQNGALDAAKEEPSGQGAPLRQQEQDEQTAEWE